MGEPVIKQVGQSSGQVGTGRGQAAKGESTRAATTDPRTTTTGDRTTGDRTTQATGKTEKEVVPRLANVDPEQKKRDERNARRRELYAKKKAEQGTPVKTRKVTNNSKASSETVGTEQIAALIGMVSGVVASRPNMAHWQLTPSEIESISKPLSNILSNSDAFKGLAEHSDAVALVTACVTILLPRLVITATMKKERRKNHAGRSTKPVSKQSEPNQNGKDHADSGKNDPGTTDHGADHGESKFYVGDPISI